MAVTREQIDGQITAKMQQDGLTREQAIEELLAGANRGAGEAEKEVILAQDALLRAKTEEEKTDLNATIAREGRYASLERDRIVLLKEIAKEDKKKSQQ